MKFFKFNIKKKNYSSRFQADEMLYEGQALDGTTGDGFKRYQSAINRFSSYIPLIIVLVVSVIFTGRIYWIQHETKQDLADRAVDNAFSIAEVVADRGEIKDRAGKNLVWNTKKTDQEFATRNYIDKPGFAHVLGFISPPLTDSNGNLSRATYVARSGVEKVYDNLLQGKNGLVQSETKADFSELSGKKITLADAGQDITLSIDAEIQSALYDSIKSLAKQVNFKRGSGAIMDISTGELIAITNYPEYDRDFNNTQGEQAYINLFTHGLFTPGSIVKPFMALAALNEDIITSEKQILSTKMIVIPNRYNPANPTLFSDWKAHGYVNVREAISVSSNAYFYAVGGGLYDQPGIGITKINQYMTAFGLGEPAGISGFEKISGVVPSVDWKRKNYPNDPDWRLGDTFNTSIGQYGWQVTPLQMLRGIAAIANRGTLVQPTLLVSGDQTNNSVPLVVKDSAYQIVHEGMRQAATEGTARGLNVPYVNVAAKTGTAELGVSKANVNSWVVGFWPYEKPKYAFTVIMNEGSRYNTTGATYTMRQLFDWMNEHRPEYFVLPTESVIDSSLSIL